jgi:hypothetical protein
MVQHNQHSMEVERARLVEEHKDCKEMQNVLVKAVSGAFESIDRFTNRRWGKDDWSQVTGVITSFQFCCAQSPCSSSCWLSTAPKLLEHFSMLSCQLCEWHQQVLKFLFSVRAVNCASSTNKWLACGEISSKQLFRIWLLSN